MEIKEKRPELADLANPTHGPDRSTRGRPGKITRVAFIGYTFMYCVVFFYILLVGQVFIPPVLIEAALVLLAAVVVATRWRWAPYLGVLIALLTLYDPIFQPHDIYTFMHPGQSNYEFSLILLVIAFGLVSLVACIGTIIRTRWGAGSESRLPRFAGYLLSGFAGVVVGLILLSLIVTIVPQTSAASIASNGQPVVHMTAGTFAQNVVLVPKGESLQIVNDSSVEHILQNGSWDTRGTAHPEIESGAPTLRNVDITSGSKEVGPFTTAGVYHIYCTLHPGMNLTIVVQ
jgi:plastocyanin/Flp pilus assembly pilin Flp